MTKIRDVVGLYLDPPERAIVLSVDEKTQIQALDRTQPMLPLRPGQVERHTHNYERHGTTSLFAALEVATGQVTTEARARHTGADFLAFLRRLDRVYPDQELHVILDNVSTHKTPAVRAWLERHPRITFHFTPTSASWLNQIETWFSVLTRGVLTDMVLISDRPAEVDDRAVPGHWEGDLIIGGRSHSAGTLVERQTRYVLLVALPAGRSASAVRDALAAHILRLPEQLRRTLTWDRGHEMAEHVRFTVDTGVAVYFCDPRSPWQRAATRT